METNVVIREAVPDDAEALIRHVKELTAEPDVCVSMAPDEFDYSVDDERKMLADSLAADNSLFLVALAGQELVGELTCKVNSRRRAQSHVATLGMSVRSDWRHKGIGAKLMERAIEWARQSNTIKRLQLQVFATNEPAIRLYKKCGFVQEGILRKAVFRHGKFHDDLVMALLLEEAPSVV